LQPLGVRQLVANMGCATAKGQKSDAPAGGGGSSPATNSDEKAKAKEDNKDLVAKIDFCKSVPLFRKLPNSDIPILATLFKDKQFKAGEDVVKQGEEGETFFLIREGSAEVLIDGAKVATLSKNDYFGEKALLSNETRNATVKAAISLSTFYVTQADFFAQKLQSKLVFANRIAVGGARAGGEAKKPSPKTEEEKKLIAEALKGNEYLATMVKLDQNRIQDLVSVAWKEKVTPGTEVIKEGDLDANYFYIVQDGTFEVTQSDQSNDASKVVKEFQEGTAFGELALLYLVPRAATVKAKTDATLWVIDRSNFKRILMTVSTSKMKEYGRYLDNLDLLTSLLKEEKEKLAEAMVEVHFMKGEVIMAQGERGSTFYVLHSGEVALYQKKEGSAPDSYGQQIKTIKGTPSDPQYFGEKALLESEERAATIVVTSEKAKALALDKGTFEVLLGPLKEIMSTSKAGTRQSMAGGAAGLYGKDQRQKRAKIHRKDLEKIGLLGCGGFGTVELFEHKQTKESYAMKGLSKGYIVKTGMQDSVMNEKNILLMTNSAFVINLFETFNGTQSLYFLLEPALGGELYATYNRKGFHGSEKHAKYYVAGVVYAFEHLHERYIIYRDLKPENLLLTESGHIKLTDMGLAKFVVGKTFTTCGTPDYFAPELIASHGHTNAVDWWTLGILIFELMSGHPPFESPYPMQIYSKVMKGINKVQMPLKCQGDCGNLIKALLKSEPGERLPLKPGGTKNIMEHKWFTSSKFDWEKMKALELPVPYKPTVKSKTDISNFAARKEDIPRQVPYTDNGTGWDAKFATSD
jgi:CRP-like cAMP-binding protein